MLFSFSLTRAVNLEILPIETTQEFIQTLKRLIARGEGGGGGGGGGRRPEGKHSDNAKTFEKASKWIKIIYKDTGMQKILVTEQVK